MAAVEAISVGIVAIGEALREVLEVGDLGRALRLHVEHADIEALRRVQGRATRRAGSPRHQQSVRHLRRILDQVADHCSLALGELAVEIAVERLAVDGRIGRDDLQRGGIGRERQIAVGVERLARVQASSSAVRRSSCWRHRLLDLGLDLHAPRVGFGQTLAQHEADRALDVVALLQRAFSLGDDVPGGGDAQAGGPQNRAEIGPDAGILMGEHHHLHAVVRHVPGHGGVGGHHVAAECFVLALDGEIAPRVPGPLVEGRRRILAQPGDEELGDLVIVDCIRVRRVGD